MSDALIFAGEDLPCEIHGTHNCECFAADLFRGFHHFSGAWYANANHLQPGIEDIVDFGMYCADGSGDGGGAMVWYAQGPRIEIFHDGWSMIVGMSDLISTLGNLQNKRITPAEFCDILTALGFRDLTARERTTGDFGGQGAPIKDGDVVYYNTSDYGWLKVWVGFARAAEELATIYARCGDEVWIAGDVVSFTELVHTLPAGAEALNEDESYQLDQAERDRGAELDHAAERTASDFGGAHGPARYAYYQATGFEQTIGAYVAELDARRWYRCKIVGAAKGESSVCVSFDLGYTEIEIDVLVASLHTSAPAGADVVNEEEPHAV